MKLTMENQRLLSGHNNNNNNNNYKYGSAAKGDDIDNNNPSSSLLGESALIDGDDYIDCNIHDNNDNDDDSEVDYEQQQLELQLQHNFHEKYRFLILAIVVITPMGVKFFKASQSSFEEYLMNDPRILMSATTYSLMLSLMSIPVATLIGGVLLDYNHRERGQTHNHNEHQPQKNTYIKRFFNPGSLSCLGTTRTPSYSAIAFIGISFLGIVIYGYGLEMINSQTIALIGATIFGLGEGCVVVASRTFVAHAFYGSDGAFAQGVLVAMNNLAMVASKIIIPWLIENENDKKSHMIIGGNSSSKGSNHNDISIGIVACCVAMLMSLVAAILYAAWFGGTPRPQRPQQQQRHHHAQPQEAGETSREMLEKKEEEERPSKSMISSMISNMISSTKAYCQKLPLTFWIVAIGRAIFVVTFKVFSHNSNSILMVSTIHYFNKNEKISIIILVKFSPALY
jgi:MFS family permease